MIVKWHRSLLYRRNKLFLFAPFRLCCCEERNRVRNSVTLSPMAISDVPESLVVSAGNGGTAAVQTFPDLNRSSMRRRHGSTTAGSLFDADGSAEAAVRDSSGSDDSLSSKDGAAGEEEEEKKDSKVDHAAGNASEQVAGGNFTYRASVPVHRKVKESPLSSDNIFRQSHAGLFNLCVVVLVAVNSRLIIENIMKYGWLIKYGFWFSSKSLRDWPLFMCCISLNIFPLAAYMVEKLAQEKRLTEPVIFLLHTIITTVAILYPVLVTLRCDSAFVSGVTLMMFACIVWLKLVSYAHTNHDLRSLSVSNEKEETLPNTLNMENPYDVSFKSLAYFMVAPTLCYQVAALFK